MTVRSSRAARTAEDAALTQAAAVGDVAMLEQLLAECGSSTGAALLAAAAGGHAGALTARAASLGMGARLLGDGCRVHPWDGCTRHAARGSLHALSA